MTQVYRIGEVTKPNGPVSRSKLYADAAAGRLELRKVGGSTVIEAPEWDRYIRGQPLVHRSAARAA